MATLFEKWINGDYCLILGRIGIRWATMVDRFYFMNLLIGALIFMSKRSNNPLPPAYLTDYVENSGLLRLPVSDRSRT